MQDDSHVIASGNLATVRRTISGVLGQLQLLGTTADSALQVFTAAGLPARALEEPDFPISLQQELEVCSALVDRLPAAASPTAIVFEARGLMGIENLGVLGMAMRHADTALDALQVCLEYPQLTWGHSRMIVRRQDATTRFAFTMERPQLRDVDTSRIDRLVEFCVSLDLVSSMRNIEDIVDDDDPPLRIELPIPEPKNWDTIALSLHCPVVFQAEEACLVYSEDLQGRALPRANPLVYRSFATVARQLSQMLGDEIGLSEQVTRWLWAHSPPLRRGEIARQLAVSERSLTRQLAKEGTSYAELLARVQQERACNFLRNPALSVTEIAYRLGYTEPAAFSRAFSKWTGLSPLRWRKRAGQASSSESG